MTEPISIAADQTQAGTTIIPGTVTASQLRVQPQAPTGRISIDARTFGGVVALLAAALVGAGTTHLASGDARTAEALRPIANVAVDRSETNATGLAEARTGLAQLSTRVTALESEEQQQDREIGELMVLQVDALAYLLDAIKELAKKEHLDIDDPPSTLIEGVQRMRAGRAGKK